MYAEDLTFWDQTFIASVFMLVFVAAFYAGCFIKGEEQKADQRRRDVENEAHRQSVEGLRGHQRTDITA